MIAMYPDRLHRDMVAAINAATAPNKRAAGYALVMARFPVGTQIEITRSGVIVFQTSMPAAMTVVNDRLRVPVGYGTANVLANADIDSGEWRLRLRSGGYQMQERITRVGGAGPYFLADDLSTDKGLSFSTLELFLAEGIDYVAPPPPAPTPAPGPAPAPAPAGTVVASTSSLISDMTGGADRVLKGESAFWAFRSVNYMGNKPVRWNTPAWWNRNLVPHDNWWNSIIPWLVLFEGEGNTSWDVRMNIAFHRLYMLISGTWYLIAQGNTLGGNLQPKGGGYYGGGAGAATWRDEPDGTASLGLQNPYNWHGYLGVNPLSNQANIQAVHVRTRVRLIGTAAAINNAVWLVHAGADYYPQYGDPGFIIPAVAISRPRLLTGSWQDISMTTLSDVGHQEPGGGITAAQLAANPPPYN